MIPVVLIVLITYHFKEPQKEKGNCFQTVLFKQTEKVSEPQKTNKYTFSTRNLTSVCLLSGTESGALK